ncbi:hypothetical protein CHARACLAT_014374 [Characodon lateralis]|uniref:Uncharacterized protein n=1 Tax=Characodon lateralis TaxID=208331 RepID=A0ABU7E210_9TELE|nr:hypothetical protein [Characodon lateralis]
MRDGRIKEILEVLLPPADNVPSRGQQPPTPTVNRDLRYSGWISSTPEVLPPWSLTILVTSAWVIHKSNSESSVSASTREGVTVGLRKPSKYSFHHPVMSPVEVSNSAPPL